MGLSEGYWKYLKRLLTLLLRQDSRSRRLDLFLPPQWLEYFTNIMEEIKSWPGNDPDCNYSALKAAPQLLVPDVIFHPRARRLGINGTPTCDGERGSYT